MNLVPNPEIAKSLHRLVPDRLRFNVTGHLTSDNVQEGLHILGFSLDYQFHVAAGKITNVTGHRKSFRQAPGRVTKTHTLYSPAVAYPLAQNHGKSRFHC